MIRILALLLLSLSVVPNIQPAQAHPWGGLVVDAAGRIFFTFVCPIISNSHVACVLELDQGVPKPTLNAGTSPSDLILTRSPNRQLFGAQRELLRGAYQSRIWHINPSGSHETIVEPTSDPLEFTPEAYTVDDAGSIIYAHETRLYKRTPEGIVTPFAGGGVAGHVDGPLLNARFERITSMAWGPDSTLYIVDRDHLRRIVDGNVQTVAENVRSDSPENLPFAGANIIFDIAVDSQHNVYLAYFGNRRVLKVSLVGRVTTFLESEDDWTPHGIDVFEDEVYILESTIAAPKWWEFWKTTEIRPRVRKVASSGEVTILYEHLG